MSTNYLQMQSPTNQALSNNSYLTSVNGLIAGENRNHFYPISLSSRSHLSIGLDNSIGNADLEIIDSQGGIVAGSYSRRRRDESIEQTLDAGDYQIRVFGVGRDTTYRLNVTQSVVLPANAYKWDGLFQDWEVGQQIQTRIQDGEFDRNDAIAIFDLVMDGGVVDAWEFADLQTLVERSQELNLPESVQVLANKVINGDAANQFYQGQALGNLSIGSSANHLENLVSKWFWGSDRPYTTSNYAYVQGELFQNGVSYEDIRQGQTNDCYFLAGLALAAVHAPDTITNMFSDNGDGTYTVKFWRDGVADYITVDQFLPVDSSSRLVYATKGENADNLNNELWVALAEKAYAQLNASGWLNQEPSNSYRSIGKGGYISDAIKHITGEKASLGNLLDFNRLMQAIDTGLWVGIGTKTTTVNSNLVAGHAYALIDYDSVNQKFKLFNPWGIGNSTSKPGVVELSWSEMLANVSYWDAIALYTVSG